MSCGASIARGAGGGSERRKASSSTQCHAADGMRGKARGERKRTTDCFPFLYGCRQAWTSPHLDDEHVRERCDGVLLAVGVYLGEAREACAGRRRRPESKTSRREAFACPAGAAQQELRCRLQPRPASRTICAVDVHSATAADALPAAVRGGNNEAPVRGREERAGSRGRRNGGRWLLWPVTSQAAAPAGGGATTRRGNKDRRTRKASCLLTRATPVAAPAHLHERRKASVESCSSLTWWGSNRKEAERNRGAAVHQWRSTWIR